MSYAKIFPLGSLGSVVNTGVLQIQGGVYLDSTLRILTDQINTPSVLRLSTTSVTNYGGGAIPTNTAFGDQALLSNTSGTGITAIGYQALTASTAINGTAVGFQAGLSVTTGVQNLLIGYQSGTGITGGSNNVLVGTITGSGAMAATTVVGNLAVASGNSNSMVGYQANDGGFNNSVVLGRIATATANNQFVVGSVAYPAGAVAAETNTTISSWAVKINGTGRKLLLLDTAQNVIDVKQSVAASTSTTTVNWANGNLADITLTSSTTLTLSAPVIGTYIVKLTQGGAGSFTVTWPATVKWSGGIAPVLTTTAGKLDIITLVWDGTSYYGSYALNF